MQPHLFQRPVLFVWSWFHCRSQDPDKLITCRKTSVRWAKNIRTDQYQNKVIMDGRYEPAHKFHQWTFARRERRGMLIVFKWNSASRYCAESSWSSWWKILSIDCLHKTTAIDSQNIAVCVCVSHYPTWFGPLASATPTLAEAFNSGGTERGPLVWKSMGIMGLGSLEKMLAKHTYTHTVDRQTAASIMGKLMEMIHGWIHTATHNDGINSEHIYTQSGKSSICKLTNYMTEWHIQPACPSTLPRTHKRTRKCQLQYNLLSSSSRNGRKIENLFTVQINGISECHSLCSYGA